MHPACSDLGLQLLTCRYSHVTEWTHDDLAAPYWRVYWNRDRNASIFVGAEEIRLEPKQLVLIPPDTSYATRLRKPMQQFFIHFVLKSSLCTAQPQVYTSSVTRQDLAMLHECIALLEKPDAPSLHLTTLALALAHRALAALPEERLTINWSDARVDAAIHSMRASLECKVPNEVFAHAAGMNTNAFIRLFREVVGEPPQSYFTRLRIEHGCVLLHYTRKTIDEIATQMGFCDRYHFSRAFSALRGIGPAAFRKQQMQDYALQHGVPIHSVR